MILLLAEDVQGSVDRPLSPLKSVQVGPARRERLLLRSGALPRPGGAPALHVLKQGVLPVPTAVTASSSLRSH